MNPKRYPKPWLPLIFLAIGAAIGLLTAGLLPAKPAAEASEQRPPSPALAVGTLVVELEEGYARRRVFSGRVEANRASNLGFERAGLLQEVLVREGDAVTRNQVVARLDSALLESRRRELEAAMKDTDASLSLAEATLRRFRDSVDDGAVTRQALDEARESERAARARVEVAKARIASVDLDIAKSELRAPFDGVVIGRLGDEGRVLAVGDPVLELQESAVPEIRVGIAGSLADTLLPGQEYELSWRGRAFSARLRALLPVRNKVTRTLDALFVPPAPPAGLHAGELVELDGSQWVEEPGLWLPLSALAAGPRGLWQTYATEPLTEPVPDGLIADHRIAPRPVEVIYQENERVFVRGSLVAGDRVVSVGLHRVVPGQLVRVLGDTTETIAMGVK